VLIFRKAQFTPLLGIVILSPLVVVLLGCMWVTPRAVVGIVAKFAHLKQPLG
jgi:hypothetical protein